MFGWDRIKWIAGWDGGGMKYSRSDAGAGGVDGPPESKSEDPDSEPSECASDSSESVGEGRGVGGTGVKGSWGIGTAEVGVMKHTCFLMTLGVGWGMETGLRSIAGGDGEPGLKGEVERRKERKRREEERWRRKKGREGLVEIHNSASVDITGSEPPFRIWKHQVIDPRTETVATVNSESPRARGGQTVGYTL